MRVLPVLPIMTQNAGFAGFAGFADLEGKLLKPKGMRLQEGTPIPIQKFRSEVAADHPIERICKIEPRDGPPAIECIAVEPDKSALERDGNVAAKIRRY